MLLGGETGGRTAKRPYGGRSHGSGRRGLSGSQAAAPADLPEPDALAAEIVDDLEAALEQFRAIAEDLGEEQISPQAA